MDNTNRPRKPEEEGGSEPPPGYKRFEPPHPGYFTTQRHLRFISWVPKCCPGCGSSNIRMEHNLSPGSTEVALTCRGCNQEVLVWMKHPGI